MPLKKEELNKRWSVRAMECYTAGKKSRELLCVLTRKDLQDVLLRKKKKKFLYLPLLCEKRKKIRCIRVFLYLNKDPL